MGYEKERIYQNYISREENRIHAPFDPEIGFYLAVSNGDVTHVMTFLKKPLHQKKGLGMLSASPLQNFKYHFVITAAMCTRFCIFNGMDVSVAFALSDFYIQKADVSQTIDSLSVLHRQMCLDYTNKMKQLSKTSICSLPITKCIDFIYDNLHKRITMAMLSSVCGLSPSYLSRIFKKETGMTVSDYIVCRKLKTAENMLLYSDFSSARIASTLAFPSQSYFSSLFKKRTGITPCQFRKAYFRDTFLPDCK